MKVFLQLILAFLCAAAIKLVESVLLRETLSPEHLVLLRNAFTGTGTGRQPEEVQGGDEGGWRAGSLI